MPTTMRCASRLRSLMKRTSATSSASALDAVDLAQQLRIGRVRLLLEDVQRKGDVGGGQPRAVGEARLRAQQEAVGQLVRGIAHRAREQAVDRIGLVAVAAHQGVERRRHARRAVALLGKNVQRVERVEVLVAARVGDLQRQQAALRRVGIDIGEALEIRRQREIAERGEAVRFDRVLGQRARRADAAGGERAPPPSISARRALSS